MASKQQIIDVLNRLGNTQQNSQQLTILAGQIKEQQKKSKIAIEACINLIGRLANRRNQLEDVVTAANAVGDRENRYITQLTDILSGSPNKDEIDAVINQLRTTVDAQIERDSTIGTGIMDREQRKVLELPPVEGEGPLNGGFNWRSKSSKRKKSSRRTIKRSNSRRKTKSKTRTRRSKSKSSN